MPVRKATEPPLPGKEKPKTPEIEEVEGEVVTDESPGGEPGSSRKIRVYDNGGDFVIEVPNESTITFGYFNPASPRDLEGGGRGYGPGPGNVARQTALRIYETTKTSNQLACFLGVKGFRDLRIKKTILQAHITVERREESDEDSWNLAASSKRQITTASEDEGLYPF